MCVAVAATSVILMAATATFAQQNTTPIGHTAFEPGSMQGSLTYQGSVQHQFIAPHIQSVGPYIQDFQGLLDGVGDHANLPGSFGLEDFPDLELIHGNGHASWEAVRELTQMTEPDWVHPTEMAGFQAWQ